MIRKKRNNKETNLGDSVNLIPMINIIFLLLIFFLLTGVIQKKDESNIALPESFFGKKKLTIDSEGKILFENSTANLDFLKSMEIISDQIIVINTDEKAKIKRFNEIVKIFKSKGLKKIYINVKHKND